MKLSFCLKRDGIKLLCKSIKKWTPKGEIRLIYKIDNNLEYTLDEIIEVDDSDLSELHHMQKKHFAEKKNIHDEITISWVKS